MSPRKSPEAHSLKSLGHLVTACSRACAIGFSVRDTDARFLYLNTAIAGMLGVAGHDNTGKTTRELLGSVAPQVEQILARVIETGEPMTGTVGGCVPKVPEPREWTCRYVPVKDPAHNVRLVGALGVEVGLHRRITRALSSLDTSGLSLPEMIEWATDLRETLTTFDAFAEELLTSLTAPNIDTETLVRRAQVMDERLRVLRELLQAQAVLLKDFPSEFKFIN